MLKASGLFDEVPGKKPQVSVSFSVHSGREAGSEETASPGKPFLK